MSQTSMLIGDNLSGLYSQAVQVVVTEKMDGRVSFEIVQLAPTLDEQPNNLRGYFFDEFD